MHSPARPAHAASRRRRAMGQHFLSNTKAAAALVHGLAPKPAEHVLEIGPGRGALTGLLLEAGARVTAVEFDAMLAAHLRERFAGNDSFHLIEADILKCDIAAIASDGALRVLANLPYSITGEVLMRLLLTRGISEMTLMLQREVVNRMVSPPGGRVYGSLSVVSQYFTTPRVVMQLSPGSFTPPPTVSSSVVVMPFRTSRELSDADEASYPPFVRMIFAHRRRTLLNNLKAAALAAPERILASAGIDPLRRPETLSRQESLALFAAIKQSFPPGAALVY